MDVRFRLTRKRVALFVGLATLFDASGIAYATEAEFVRRNPST